MQPGQPPDFLHPGFIATILVKTLERFGLSKTREPPRNGYAVVAENLLVFAQVSPIKRLKPAKGELQGFGKMQRYPYFGKRAKKAGGFASQSSGYFRPEPCAFAKEERQETSQASIRYEFPPRAPGR
jgi:hypothetical protein